MKISQPCKCCYSCWTARQHASHAHSSPLSHRMRLVLLISHTEAAHKVQTQTCRLCVWK